MYAAGADNKYMVSTYSLPEQIASGLTLLQDRAASARWTKDSNMKTEKPDVPPQGATIIFFPRDRTRP
jgi:hypothetical protein